MNIVKNDILFALGATSAVWFALTSMFWWYWLALIVAYPFGFAAFLIWLIIKQDNKKRNTIIPITLIIGTVLSLGMLLYIIIAN